MKDRACESTTRSNCGTARFARPAARIQAPMIRTAYRLVRRASMPLTSRNGLPDGGGTLEQFYGTMLAASQGPHPQRPPGRDLHQRVQPWVRGREVSPCLLGRDVLVVGLIQAGGEHRHPPVSQREQQPLLVTEEARHLGCPVGQLKCPFRVGL